MQKLLIYIGLIIVLVGLLWPWLSKIPLGRLPGDIVINKTNFKICIPLTTMLLISILLTLLLRIFKK
ncbi:MAG TPA: DUF2905 domain-containing protein [bacterium]|nr:DUF2905 domain-containing protein [bacterium]